MTSALHPLYTDMPKPHRFTYPFCYTPHPLVLMAAEEVKRAVRANPQWLAEAEKGKMFGVLVVETEDGVGFLAAYSGLFCGRNKWEFFVPPVYDLLAPGGYFQCEEDRITVINRRISAFVESQQRLDALAVLKEVKSRAAAEEADFRALMAASKAERQRRRAEGGAEPEALIRESQYQKAELRRLRKRHADQIAAAESHLATLEQPIVDLRRERRERSEKLQEWLFNQFDMLNARGERRTLSSIFADTPQRIPPSGAGECCAPKLLQYAYEHHLRPLAMGEFWWGESPKGEIRHHGQFYPSCRGKCLPILSHMLQGLDVEENPLERSAESIKILYHDADIIVVDKPAGLLSVPGRSGQTSVAALLEEEYGTVLPVHRLDMDTSGLIIYARHTAAHKALQAQFLSRSVKKRYTALVADSHHRLCVGDSGTIRLPLRADHLDRPRQIVDHHHGKPSLTEWRVERIVGSNELPSEAVEKHPHDTQFLLLTLIPHTGRTHQLRVHCAHRDGLGAPILGDRLYGKAANTPQRDDIRLHLHASRLAFLHPTTLKEMVFQSPPAFENKKS